jgi:hypothetical protein
MNRPSECAYRTRRALAALISGAALFAACSQPFAADPKAGPAKVEPIEGSPVARVTLIESASNRLGIETAPVREELIAPRDGKGTPALRKVIAYSAVIYDTSGAAWAYTNPQPLAFVREPLDIEYSRGDLTVLRAGPASGTPVVVVGAAELYGTETGVK